MDPVVQGLIVAVSTFLLGSSGYWVYLRNARQAKDLAANANTHLLMGLAQDKITQLGMCYIERGWVSRDEYDDLRRYLYEPYVALGGNGTAERIMHAVERLPFHSAASLLEHSFREIPIRETDPTGVPGKGIPDHEGEDRRG